jgi:hypothetical protein
MTTGLVARNNIDIAVLIMKQRSELWNNGSELWHNDINKVLIKNVKQNCVLNYDMTNGF